MTWLYFWIGALATYRLTVFISRDKGPFGIFKGIRSNPWLKEWAKCPFCTSPYCASLVSVIFWLSGVQESLWLWILIAFSWSSITIMADRTFTADYQT